MQPHFRFLHKIPRFSGWLIGGIFFFILVAFPEGVMRLLQPVQRLFSFGAVSLSEQTTTPQKDLSLIEQSLLLEQLTEENTELKALMGFIERQSFDVTAARILSQSITPLENTFFIDRGEEDGLAIGDPVVIKNGVYIGRIVELYSRFARVRAVTDRNAKTAATILHETKTIGMVQGNIGGFLSMELIPQDAVISEGDLVVTSGLESGVPPDLLLGTISVLSHQPEDPFQKATIEPLVDYRFARFVGVIHL